MHESKRCVIDEDDHAEPEYLSIMSLGAVIEKT